MRNAFRFGACCLCVLTAVTTLSSHSVTAASPKEAVFTASDYRFDGPETIPAGQTTVRLRNRGKEPHQLQLLLLDAGKTPAQLAAALQPGTHGVPAWARQVGGPNAVAAGQTAEATLFLETGTYIIICGIPGKNHQTHAALGMQKALRVSDSSPSPPEFRGNFHMAMFEYEFVVVQPLRKGRHTFYVVNRGNQIHQASFIRLNAGASTDDVLAAMHQDNATRLPGTLIGGMSGLEPGRDGTFTADLTPGRYAIMCLFSNAIMSESHAAKGMVLNFTIE